MIGVAAAIVLPLAGATHVNLQIESGGVHLIAAAGVHAITIRTARSGNAAPPRVEVTRTGRASMAIALTGHPGASLPFVQNSAGTVAYEIVYPASVRIEAYDLSGDVTLDGERVRASVETNSGSIVANDARGELDLAADAGNITVTLARGWNAPSLRMQSGNGSLHLTVPAAFRARLDASTDAGRVHDALAKTSAKHPFVWLYTRKGDVFISSL